MTKTIESMESKMFRLRSVIHEMLPLEQCDYRNIIIADGIAKGHGDKMTEDWLRKALLSDVEDGFMTYDEALAFMPKYTEAIHKLMKLA